MKQFLVLTVLAIGAFGLLGAGCATPTTPPVAAGSTDTEQAPLAVAGDVETDALIDGMYYRQGVPITDGWNGLAWGTSIERFQSRFPYGKKRQPNQEVWTAGSDEEIFFGVSAPVSYYFDPQGRFIAVSFTADDLQQVQAMVNAMVQAFGPPKEPRPIWTFGRVTVFVVHHTVVIRGIPPDA